MTAKKRTRKKGEVEVRARAIVGDVKRYDYDTRRTLATALENKNLYRRAETLAAMVAQAEAGNIVEGPLDCVEEDYQGIAHRTIQFLEIGLPDWLLQVVCSAINQAARIHNIQVIPDDAEGNYSARALGDLFRVSELLQFSNFPEPTLAEHIAAVLNHPDIPARIYNPLSEAISEIAAADAVQNNAAVISLALSVAAEEGGAR